MPTSWMLTWWAHSARVRSVEVPVTNDGAHPVRRRLRGSQPKSADRALTAFVVAVQQVDR
ncbi:MAG: hypothetical protein QOH48_2112 [Actinomycetota bacterium]|jgi:hypothetical protein|nr:hypothetical protein [Actinomycetota bacterium]